MSCLFFQYFLFKALVRHPIKAGTIPPEVGKGRCCEVQGCAVK